MKIYFRVKKFHPGPLPNVFNNGPYCLLVFGEGISFTHPPMVNFHPTMDPYLLVADSANVELPDLIDVFDSVSDEPGVMRHIHVATLERAGFA